jgi:hypothetical protein
VGEADMAEQKRYSAAISTSDKRRIRELSRLGIDVLSARADVAGGLKVRARVTLDQVGVLAEAGYEVLISRTGKPSYQREFISFEDWRQQLFPELDAEKGP